MICWNHNFWKLQCTMLLIRECLTSVVVCVVVALRIKLVLMASFTSDAIERMLKRKFLNSHSPSIAI